MTKAADFLAAKQIIRLHPEKTDEQVADEIGVKLVDTAGMETIRQARKDVGAGDIPPPPQ